MENVVISILSIESTVRATGHTDQILGLLRVENNSDSEIEIGGTEDQITDQLGVSIGNETPENMPKDLSFVVMGPPPKRKQYTLEGRSVSVQPTEDAIIQVRLSKEPGAEGSFNFCLGEDVRAFTITA